MSKMPLLVALFLFSFVAGCRDESSEITALPRHTFDANEALGFNREDAAFSLAVADLWEQELGESDSNLTFSRKSNNYADAGVISVPTAIVAYGIVVTAVGADYTLHVTQCTNSTSPDVFFCDGGYFFGKGTGQAILHVIATSVEAIKHWGALSLGNLKSAFRALQEDFERLANNSSVTLEAARALVTKNLVSINHSASSDLAQESDCSGTYSKQGRLYSPKNIRYSQDSINPASADGYTLSSLEARMRNDKCFREAEVPPISLVRLQALPQDVKAKLIGQGAPLFSVFSVDNRRLYAAKKVNLPVRGKWASPSEIAQFGTLRRFTTTNAGASIVIRAGY